MTSRMLDSRLHLGWQSGYGSGGATHSPFHATTMERTKMKALCLSWTCCVNGVSEEVVAAVVRGSWDGYHYDPLLTCWGVWTELSLKGPEGVEARICWPFYKFLDFCQG